MSTVERTSLAPQPRISPRFGSELEDVTLLDMTDDEVEALKQLGAERGIVVVRDQKMTPAQQAAFAHRLGELTMYPVKEGAQPELLAIHADENSKHAAGEKWHTDISSEVKPPSLSMLRMEVVPESGGDHRISPTCTRPSNRSRPRCRPFC